MPCYCYDHNFPHWQNLFKTLRGMMDVLFRKKILILTIGQILSKDGTSIHFISSLYARASGAVRELHWGHNLQCSLSDYLQFFWNSTQLIDMLKLQHCPYSLLSLFSCDLVLFLFFLGQSRFALRAGKHNRAGPSWEKFVDSKTIKLTQE